jgi:hypothetical protein
MIVTPFETYQHYLSLKNHFTNPKYDFFKYGAKTRASITSFNKRRDKYFFERTSRKYSDKEVVDFLVSNFVAADNPLVQRTKQRIVLGDKIRRCLELFQRSSTHP